MDRNLASSLALASTAILAVVLAAFAPGDARADDITIDNTPFKAARSRAEVRSELFSQPASIKAGAGEWTLQSNQAIPLKSASTKEQVRAEYKASREQVSALLAEDSGSSYFIKAPRSVGTATMGAPAR